MATTIITRETKGAPLSHTEMDANLTNLQATADQAHDAIVSQLAIGNIMNPLFHMPLKNDLSLARGVGAATFSRASTATYIDRYGVLKTAAIGEARLEKEGLLLEGASTNIVVNSEDPTLSPWTTVSTTLSTDGTKGIDGVTDMLKLSVTDSSLTTNSLRQNMSFTDDGSKWTWSVVCKKGSSSQIVIRGDATGGTGLTFSGYFDFATESFSQITGGATGAIRKLGNGRYRISISVSMNNTGNTNVFIMFFPYQSSGGAADVYIEKPQLENLPFASSYIPTGGSPATRATESLYVPYSDNAANNFDEFSYVFSLKPLGIPAANSWVFNPARGNYSLIQLTSADKVFGYNGETENVEYTGLCASKTKKRFALTVDSGNLMSLYVDGGIQDTNQNTVYPSDYTPATDGIFIGGSRAFASPYYGHIEDLRVYDRALTAAEVRAA